MIYERYLHNHEGYLIKSPSREKVKNGFSHSVNLVTVLCNNN